MIWRWVTVNFLFVVKVHRFKYRKRLSGEKEAYYGRVALNWHVFRSKIGYLEHDIMAILVNPTTLDLICRCL